MGEEYNYEKRVVSILIGREGYEDECCTVSEFKQHSNDAALAEEKLAVGWVLWRENEIYNYHYQQLQLQLLQLKIITLLKHIASDWKACKDQVYKVDMEEEEEEEHLGGIGRAYRNKQPESTPDLRLYSTNEFPLRDEAACCGFRGYMVLPLFNLYTNECYGVLELLSHHPIMDRNNSLRSFLGQGLQFAGLRSTHISCFSTRHMLDRFKQPDNEITEILELAIRTVPRLSLAQVWIPCKHCPNMSSTNLCCMEMVSFISFENKVVRSVSYNDMYDCDMFYYLQACQFHNLQIDVTCFLKNMSDLSISKYPLAHYAKKARLSHCFAICLQSVNNSSDPFVMIQFFLQLKNRKDACGDSSLHLLLRIIDMKLKSFKIEQLPEKLVGQSRDPNAIQCESSDMLKVMNSHKENLSESDFTTYLETSCWQRPISKDRHEGWVFGSPVGAKLVENEVQNNLLMMPSLIKEKIEQFLKKVAVAFRRNYWLIQFWTPKMMDNRYCLETLDQPYAVGCLQKGLVSFRKECSKHHYFVDDKAKEEELGPPGRVFRNEHPEFPPSLFLYSTKEFCFRNYALHCNLEEYFALPVFDKEHKCVGVLEFIGIWSYDLYAKDIEGALKVATLSSSYIDLRPRFRDGDIPANIAKALTEVEDALTLIDKIPQLHLAQVWVPYENCASINSNVRYLELALTTDDTWEERFTNECFNYVHPKKGMIGMVLESENKSCFCRNLSEFSIADQPLGHAEREERLDVCFAICLQSSHTGDLFYVLEFFLNQSIDDLPSFFNFLLPIMKQQLPSFKYSIGKQIGEELVVEVIEFPEVNNLAFSEPGHLDVFPIKFKRVMYGQTEHQQPEDESMHCISDARQTEQGNADASDFKKTNKGKRKIGFHLSREDLTSQFGKKLKDDAKELRVGRSTIKRACRVYGIDRWPSKEKHVGNPSLYQRENGQHSQQDMQPSSSTNLRLLETPLHPNVPHANTETTQHHIVQEETENVIIKVKFEEDNIKFELCLSLGLPKLFEEVTMRLKLEMGTFKLKYLDEDDDEILLACDADLQYCSKTQKRMGKTYIQLFVR